MGEMSMSAETKKTISDVFKAVLLLVLLISAGFFLFIPSYMPYILGLILGATVSFLGFIELAFTITKAVKMEPSKANAYSAFKYHLRLIIFAAVILASIKLPQLDVVGTIVGLLSVKLVIYIMNAFSQKKSNRKEE